MIPGEVVTFTHTVGLPDGGSLELDVEATIGDYFPAVRNQDPPWPAEGGEIESLTVSTVTIEGVLNFTERLPTALHETICTRAMEEHHD